MNIERLGPYRIVRRIGRGGMGAVYEAVDEQTGQRAAVKVLSTLGDDEGFRERFVAEIKTLKKLRHENIVRLMGYGEENGRLFYAMELVEGTNLEEELHRGRRFDWREGTDIGIKLSAALKHAHDRGIIHRDIKPANVMLTDDGEVKLSDFGIAKLFGNTSMTAAGGVLGTAEYMAPEQADGRPVTALADLYSLGGLLYALLAGRPPFVAKTIPEMLQLQRFAAPDPVRHYAPDVPPELESIVAQLLHKDPQQRIRTAALLSKRLEAMRWGLSVRPQSDAAVGRTMGDGDEPDAGSDQDDFELAGPTMDDSRLPDQPSEAGTPPSIGPHKAPTLAPGDVAVHQAPTRDAPGGAPAGRAGAADVTGSPLDTVDVGAQAGAAAADAVDAGGYSIAPDAAKSVAGDADDAHSAIDTAATSPPYRSHFTTVDESSLDAGPRSDEPHWSRTLVQAAVVAVPLLALIAAAVYFFQPPSADELYERIVERAEQDSAEALLAAEDDLDAFFERFADDPRIAELESYRGDIELYRLERTMRRRARRLSATEPMSPIERAYFDATNYAQVEPERGMAKFRAIIDVYGGESELDEQSERVLELAQRQLERLERQVQAYAEGSRETLERQLERANALARSEPNAAAAIWRGVIELYADKSWAAYAVAEARRRLAEHEDRAETASVPGLRGGESN